MDLMRVMKVVHAAKAVNIENCGKIRYIALNSVYIYNRPSLNERAQSNVAIRYALMDVYQHINVTGIFGNAR